MQEFCSYFYHALKVDEDICTGCTHCMKACPTDAIRIKSGKACIDGAKCVDCGECFNVCPVRAIFIKQDDFNLLLNYKHRIALVPAVFMGQFKDNVRTSQVYACLKKIGFTHIYEVEHGVDLWVEMVKTYMKDHPEDKPFISPFCPAIVRLIQVRFPSLVNNIVHLKAPLDIAAYIISQRLTGAGIDLKDIGIFYITPCAAKIAAVKSPVEDEVSPIAGVINMDFLYNKVQMMLSNYKDLAEPINHSLTGRDIKFSLTEGEAANFEGRCFAIDGIRKAIDFLEKIENEEVETDGLIEMRACDESCAGGVLTPNNRFVAMERMKKRAAYIDSKPPNILNIAFSLSKDFYSKISGLMSINKIEPRSIMKLHSDRQKALQMVEEMKKIEASLPAVDCGACGAPSCSALAEDIVRKQAKIENCVFVKKDPKEFFNTMDEIWGDKIVKL